MLNQSLWTCPAVLIAFFSLTPVKAATELAKVNGKVITLESFNEKYKENLKFFRYKTPTKKTVLEDMIRRDLGVQEAKRLGVDKDPEVIDRVNTVLYHSLLDKQLAGKFDGIQIADEEVEKYYDANPEIRTSHIFLQLRFDATPAQEAAGMAKMKTILAKVEDEVKGGKKTFAELARTYSEGVAAAAGGDIDYQTKDKLDPKYYETSLALKKVGNISGIIRSQFGLHIIKLTGIKDFKDIDKGHYKRLLFDEKRAKIYDAYMEDLKKKASISVQYNLLKE